MGVLQLSKVKGKTGKDMRSNGTNTDLDTGKEIGDDKYGRTGARRGGCGRVVLQRLFQTVQMTCPEAGGGTLFWRSRRGKEPRKGFQSSPGKVDGKEATTRDFPKVFSPSPEKKKPRQPVMDDNRITTDNLGSSPINLEQSITATRQCPVCCFVPFAGGILQGHRGPQRPNQIGFCDFGVAFPPPRLR